MDYRGCVNMVYDEENKTEECFHKGSENYVDCKLCDGKQTEKTAECYMRNGSGPDPIF